MKLAKYIPHTLAATLLVLGVRYIWPRIETRTVTQTRTVVENRTITRIVKQPDGSSVTIIDSTTSTDSSKTKAQKATKWHVTVAAGKEFGHLEQTTYHFEIQRRIISNFYIGSGLSTTSEVRLSIGMEF